MSVYFLCVVNSDGEANAVVVDLGLSCYFVNIVAHRLSREYFTLNKVLRSRY